MSEKAAILIIEDEISIQQMLQLDLEDDYNVFVANNGKEGLEKIQWLESQHNPPAVILLDIVMPVMDGFTFLRELESQGKKGKYMIIILTGFTDMEEKIVRLLQEGNAATFLVKPLRYPELLFIEIKKFSAQKQS